MNYLDKDVAELERAVIIPFRVQQIIAGLEMEDTDQKLLDYLRFFIKKIPVYKASFVHVLPSVNTFRDMVHDTEMWTELFNMYDNLMIDMRETIGTSFEAFSDLEVNYDVREGTPLEKLLEEAEETQADLILIGQKSGTQHHGILAKKLARQVKCNALIVPTDAPKSMDHIMVPVDFSPHSAKALQTAIAMNRQLDNKAKITCVHVYDVPNLAAYNMMRTAEQLNAMIRKDREEALAGFIKTFAPEDADRIETKLIEKEFPRIGSYLHEYAEKNGVDFIVMGAKGHSRVSLLFMGSVTEKIVALNNTIPTLIIK